MGESKKYTLKIKLSDGTTHSVSFEVLLGPEGNPGESAYEAAVKGGYPGTKEEFYEDLTDLYDLELLVEGYVDEYLQENPPSGGVEFETDETLTLENGVLSVNTEVINTMTDEEIAALNAHII